MLSRQIGSTFSDIWYRVADQRPRLSPHAHVTRQMRGDHLAYIIEDPAGSQYLRLTEPAYFFTALLDGRRTVDEAWNACNAQLGDNAPTQRECIEALSKLQLFGLLIGDAPLAADMVSQRREQARTQRIRKRTGMWMFWSIPLMNPEPFLERTRILWRAIYSRWGAAVWLAVVGIGLFSVLSNWRRLDDNFDQILAMSPQVMGLLALTFLALRAVHELGHATACKAMGGRSTEIGLLMIAGILPLPYCDATSAWRFEQTWRRVLVSAAGMIVEIFIAAIAAIVWATASDDVVRSVAYNIMIIASVTTLIFNANPLLRYDGYYILSDVADAPNLAIRSREFWKFMLERHVFGVREARPPRVRDTAEAWLLGVFGLLSIPYRIFISFSIVLLIASGQYAMVGIVIAAAMTVVVVVVPIAKGLGYLLASPNLVGRRARAIAITALFFGAIGVLGGAVPFPAAGYASGTVEAAKRLPVRSQENGFLAEVFVKPGEQVEADQLIARLTNEDIETEAAITRTRMASAQAALEQALTLSPAAVDAARARMDGTTRRLARIEERLASLEVRAPLAGRVVLGSEGSLDLASFVGRFIPRGTLLAEVAQADELVVRSLLPEQDRAYVFREGESPEPVSVRLRGRAGRVVPAVISRDVAAGSSDLPSAALSTLFGGDIAIDPSSRDRLRSSSKHFLIEVKPEEPIEGAQPGLRARVRFGLEPEPLLVQLYRKGRRFLSSRILP